MSFMLARGEATREVYSQPGSAFSGDLHLGLLQVDLQLAHASQPEGTTQFWRRQEANAELVLQTFPDDLQARLNRAVASYYLGNFEEARDELVPLQPTMRAYLY